LEPTDGRGKRRRCGNRDSIGAGSTEKGRERGRRRKKKGA
jgi:hypothetical protein